MTNSQSLDPKAFHDFEHAGWQQIPKKYHEAFADLTTQAIGPLLDSVGAGSGVRLLDVASGPGYVAAAAAERGAEVVAVDFSAAMVKEARTRFPGVEFQEGDAEELPFPSASFDAVVINFGMLHLARPDQALAEAWRALRRGGKLAFTVWAKPEEAIGFAIVLRAIQTHGDMNVPLPPGPPFFRFSETEECVKALHAAGFDSPQVSVISQTWRVPSGDVLFEYMLRSTVRTAGLLRGQKPEALENIRKTIRREAESFKKKNTVELPMPAVLATAVKK